MSLEHLPSTYFFPMNNIIQNYAWGSTTSINQLFNISNENHEPQAEIWMGAHPNGCSKIAINDQNILLSEFVNTNKASILSKKTEIEFGELPYLFKVLAAKKALSIQVHPSKEEAEVGYDKEQKSGIPLSAGHRNYKDPNHKPELVYALTPYQAMNGFRPFKTIANLFTNLGLTEITPIVSAFKNDLSSKGLQCFFTQLLSLSGAEKNTVIDALISKATSRKNEELFSLILKLSKQYPYDIGLFSPLILNVLTLQPGEAMFLEARTPHAYIKGTALEIMANSDNVIRAGLTPKHMDITELVSCTLFEEKPANSLLLSPVNKGKSASYPIPVPDFKFSIYNDVKHEDVTVNSAEILFAIDDDATVYHESGQNLTFCKGQSIFIPAYANKYQVSSQGKLARAYN